MKSKSLREVIESVRLEGLALTEQLLNVEKSIKRHFYILPKGKCEVMKNRLEISDRGFDPHYVKALYILR
jgi:hypothetical protein